MCNTDVIAVMKQAPWRTCLGTSMLIKSCHPKAVTSCKAILTISPGISSQNFFFFFFNLLKKFRIKFVFLNNKDPGLRSHSYTNSTFHPIVYIRKTVMKKTPIFSINFQRQISEKARSILRVLLHVEFKDNCIHLQMGFKC